LLGVYTVGDIQQLVIGKDGDDAMNVSMVALYVNNSDLPGRAGPLYVYQPQHGSWLNAHATASTPGAIPTLTITSATLRGNSRWTVAGNEAVSFPPATIKKEIFNSLVESMAGNLLHGQSAYWAEFDGAHVELKRTSATSFAVTLFLAADVRGINPAVDVFF